MNLILDLLFPKKCVGCKKKGSYFCQDCVNGILQTDLFCPKCGNRSVGGLTHPHCERTFGLDGLWSLGLYQGPLKKAIQRLKYEPLVRDFASPLAEIITKYWQQYEPIIWDLIKKENSWVIIPVPLHWYRENSRGFNQVALIGQLLSKKLNLAYCNGLKRIRYTSSQVKLKRAQRKENIKDAFEINCSLLPKTCVLLIDDVWTTGSTLKECCYILKRNGAKKVWALTLAR